MAGRKSDFTLPTLDDLFSTQELRDDAKLSKIRDIPLELIDDFPDHPFKVRDDEDMIQLVESVKERGVITPANDLKTKYPSLAAEWSEKNLSLTPDAVNEKSTKNVWWKCRTCGYEWKSRRQSTGQRRYVSCLC